MPIDPSAVGSESGPVERSWTSKDALLYAVVGRARDVGAMMWCLAAVSVALLLLQH